LPQPVYTKTTTDTCLIIHSTCVNTNTRYRSTLQQEAIQVTYMTPAIVRTYKTITTSIVNASVCMQASVSCTTGRGCARMGTQNKMCCESAKAHQTQAVHWSYYIQGVVTWLRHRKSNMQTMVFINAQSGVQNECSLLFKRACMGSMKTGFGLNLEPRGCFWNKHQQFGRALL